MKTPLHIPQRRSTDHYDQMVVEINSLPEQQKRILSLRFEQGMNLNEISVALNLHKDEVNQLYLNALDLLRPSLDKAV